MLGLALGGIALVALCVGGFFLYGWLTRPTLSAATPARVQIGDRLTLQGSRLGAPDTQVQIGDKPARVLQSETGRLLVEVPALPVIIGQDRPFPVRVRVGGRESQPFMVTVFDNPLISRISPDVGLPGEGVVLTGRGWDASPQVFFGTVAAEVVQVASSSISVRVPPLTDAPGTTLQVSVRAGSASSNAAPFLLGRLPVLVGVNPPEAQPGDLVRLSGRGFANGATANLVRIGEQPALLLSATDAELQAVVPRQRQAGPAPIEIRVPGRDSVATGMLTIAPLGDPVDFRFTVEPLVDADNHWHALVCSALGPAFVFSDSGGRSAAERALDAMRRLNAASVPLKASLDRDFEVRNLQQEPSVGLTGQSEVVLSISDADAAAYNEDWTHAGGRGGPVTRARLALWWSAVARDLVLLLIRGERPRHAAGYGADGRVLVELYQAARKQTNFGVPRSLLLGLKPPQVEGLRVLALRVPPGVVVSEDKTAATLPGLRLDGRWQGAAVEEGRRRNITVTFQGREGTLSLEGAVSLTLPLSSVEQPRRDTVRFMVRTGAGLRYYIGRWDGQRLTGDICAQPAGTEVVGSFELRQ